MGKGASYRKYNDRSHNSSTYHKKDGTNIRAKLKKEASHEIDENDVCQENGEKGAKNAGKSILE